VGGRGTDFEGNLSLARRTSKSCNSVTRLEQGGSRAERKESLDEWNFGSLAVAMAEIVKI
jgi:hypothetical protein